MASQHARARAMGAKAARAAPGAALKAIAKTNGGDQPSVSLSKSIARPSREAAPYTPPEDMKEMVSDAFAVLMSSKTNWSELVARDTFDRDALIVKRRMRARTRGLIDPRWKSVQRWDGIVILALLITCIYTPFEVALLPTAINASFIVGQALNAVFIIDLVMTFFVPFQSEADGHYVTSHSQIASRYLRGWFAIDLISCCPFEIIGLIFDPSTLPPGLLKPIRMLRLLRLLKLARIAKASRILARWEDHITVPYSTRALIGWSVVLLMSIHWFSCIWVLLTTIQGSLRTTELQDAVRAAIEAAGGPPNASSASCALPAGTGEAVTCIDVDDDFCPSDCLSECELTVLAQMRGWTLAHAHNEEHWICRTTWSGGKEKGLAPAVRQLALRGPRHWYEVLAIPYSNNGFIMPHNFTERAVNFVLYFLSLVLWSMFTGAICGHIANIDPFTFAYRSSMDQLNAFLREHKAPLPLCLRAREYLRASKLLRKKNATPDLLSSLSPAIRNAAVMHCASKILLRVPWMGSLESGCLGELATALSYRGVARQEVVSDDGRLLGLLINGIAARGGSILTAGMYFGDDILLTAARLHVTKRVIALTYLELATLRRETMDSVLAKFPVSAQRMRTTATKLAMCRAGVIIHAANQAKRGTAGGGAGRKGAGSDQHRLNSREVDVLLQSMTGQPQLREISDITARGGAQRKAEGAAAHNLSPRTLSRLTLTGARTIVDPPGPEEESTARTELIHQLGSRLAATEAAVRDLTQVVHRACGERGGDAIPMATSVAPPASTATGVLGTAKEETLLEVLELLKKMPEKRKARKGGKSPDAIFNSPSRSRPPRTRSRDQPQHHIGNGVEATGHVALREDAGRGAPAVVVPVGAALEWPTHQAAQQQVRVRRTVQPKQNSSGLLLEA